MCRRADNHAENEETGADHGDPPAAHDVGNGTDEGAHGGEGEEVGEDKPDPAVGAAYVGVDVGGDAAEEVDGDLAACPDYFRALARNLECVMKSTHEKP